MPPSFARSDAVPLTWTELLPEGVPPTAIASTPTLVYDPSTSQTLDFVSLAGGGVVSIWSFAAGTWSNVTPAGNLTHQGLGLSSATFDPSIGGVLLFGYSGGDFLGGSDAETWVYAAGAWSELFPQASPQGELMAGLTYDDADSAAVLLTTLNGEPDAVTWAFQAGNWTRIVTPEAPPALFGSSMAFDNASASQEIVLYAGGSKPGDRCRGSGTRPGSSGAAPG